MRKIQFNLWVTAFVLLLGCLTSFAQDYSFKVLGSKGNNQADGSHLTIGSEVLSDQIIKVVDGGYLGLAHKSGKTLEIKNSGMYKVSELEAKVNSEEQSLTDRYTSYILDELTNSKSVASHYATRRVKTGSVTRAMNQKQIDVWMPKTSDALNTVTLKWIMKDEAQVKKGAKYKVTFMDEYRQKIMEKEVEVPYLTLDLSDSKLSKHDNVMYNVSVMGSEDLSSDDYMLRKVAGKNAKKMNKEIEKLLDDSSAIKNVALAKYYEENELYGNAINAYEKALKLSDNLGAYQKLYDTFLARNGFKDVASK